jgi:hypothetical protein
VRIKKLRVVHGKYDLDSVHVTLPMYSQRLQ